MDHSPPGSSVHGILQARVLDWIAIPFSSVSSWPWDWTRVSCISCIGWCILYHCAAWEPQKALTCQRILKKKNREDSNIFLRKIVRCPWKSLNIMNSQGNANWDHDEISSHTHQNGYYQKTMLYIIKIARIGKDVEKKEPLYTIGGNVNWCSHYGKQYGGSSKNLKYNYYMSLQFHI